MLSLIRVGLTALLPMTVAVCAQEGGLPSHTYPGSRSSTDWVSMPNGIRVAVDEGISYRGTTIYLSLTHHLVGVNDETGETRWGVDVSAYWNRVAVVHTDGAPGVKVWAVELTRTDDPEAVGRRALFDLRSGGRIETNDAPKPTGDALSPREVTGDDLVVEEPFDRLVGSSEEWSALVAETLGEKRITALGPIDFATEQVYVLASGRRINHRGWRIIDAYEDGERQLLRIDRVTFQTMGGGEALHPWFAVVIPRSFDKTLIVEADVQGMIRGPRIWKERWRGRIL